MPFKWIYKDLINTECKLVPLQLSPDKHLGIFFVLEPDPVEHCVTAVFVSLPSCINIDVVCAFTLQRSPLSPNSNENAQRDR